MYVSSLVDKTFFEKISVYPRKNSWFVHVSANTKSNAEKDLMREHINKHYNDIRLLRLDYCELKEKLQLLVGNTFTSILLKSIEKSLQKERLQSFKTTNKEIANLLKNKKDDTFTNYSVPIINLSSYTPNDSEYSQLKFGLNHCFINKDKHIKKTLPLIWSH